MISGMRILVVENGSKYFSDIIKFLKKRKIIITRVNPLICDHRKINPKEYEGVILSGGADMFSRERFGFNNKVIKKFKDKPLLGVCLGHQFLVQSYGGAIYRMDLKSYGMINVTILRDNRLIKGRKRIRVFKGHHNAAAFLPDCMDQLAYSTDCETEMIEHKKRPHFGVQFHPEKGGDGHLVLNNFLRLCERYTLTL